MKDLLNEIFNTFKSQIHAPINSSLYGGSIPRDTGLLQNDITEALRVITVNGGGYALYKIGSPEKIEGTPYYAVYLEYGDYVGNSNKPNRHKGFVESFIKDEFVTSLKKYGDVKVE